MAEKDDNEASGGSGSTARVAFDMTKYLINFVPKGTAEVRLEAILDLYAKCYHAADGRRLPKN